MLGASRLNSILRMQCCNSLDCSMSVDRDIKGVPLGVSGIALESPENLGPWPPRQPLIFWGGAGATTIIKVTRWSNHDKYSMGEIFNFRKGSQNSCLMEKIFGKGGRKVHFAIQNNLSEKIFRPIYIAHKNYV